MLIGVDVCCVMCFVYRVSYASFLSGVFYTGVWSVPWLKIQSFGNLLLHLVPWAEQFGTSCVAFNLPSNMTSYSFETLQE